MKLTSPAPKPDNLARQVLPIDVNWQQWIADNRLRHCTPQSMLKTMCDAGLDPSQSEAAIAAMEHNPGYLAAKRVLQQKAKLESIMANQQKLWEAAPNYSHVEKRSRVSRDEFIQRYVIGCRPVVLLDVAHDWPALKRWSPQDLAARFGQVEVEIQAGRSSDAAYEENKLKHKQRMKLAAFVDQVLKGGDTNDYYLTANNEALRRPELAPLLQDIGSLPDLCDPARLAYESSIWFGPGGTVTPLHHDTTMLLHTQITGRKRWRFISPLQTPRLYNTNGVFSPIDLDAPDLTRFPLLQGVQVLETVLNPGETIFLPLAWWHQVKALEVSLSFSFSNLSLGAVAGSYEYADP